MKKTAIIVFIVLISGTLFAQGQRIVLPDTDSTFNDTSMFYHNLIGINVFPAFGLLGGGTMPSTKIYIQYKYMMKRANIRFGLNYINYQHRNDRLDLIIPDQAVPTDSITFRKFFDEIYTYDARLGLEYAFPRENIRFYAGVGAIFGVNQYNRNYYEFKQEIDTLFTSPNNSVVDSIYPSFYSTNALLQPDGHSNTRLIKTGFDFSLGVDFYLSDNFVISIQYTPEFAYYKYFDEDLNDDSRVFSKQVPDHWNFALDYVDLVIHINF